MQAFPKIYVNLFNKKEIKISDSSMKIHFIGINESYLLQLACALQHSAYQVSASCQGKVDKISGAEHVTFFDTWSSDHIREDLDAVVVSKHVEEGNVEVERAHKLGIPVYTPVKFLARFLRNKQRILITGKKGRVLVAAMVVHVLRQMGKRFDHWLQGSKQRLSLPIRLHKGTSFIIIEEDDDNLLLKESMREMLPPHIVALTDEEPEDRRSRLERVLKSLPKAGMIVYHETQKALRNMVKKYDKESTYLYPYKKPSFKLRKGLFSFKLKGKVQDINLKSDEHLTHVAAAWEVCQLLSINIDTFMTSIQSFGYPKEKG